MKLTLRKLTLVSAVLMTLCVVRTLLRKVIWELLLSGHPIRSSLFGDMMWCVSAMAIALFFWGLWRFREQVPQLKKRGVIGMVCLGVIVVACYILSTIVLTNWVVMIERLAMAVGLWYYYALLGTEGACEKGLDRYNSHYYALLIAVVLSVAAVALVVSDALWYCVSAEVFAAWHVGASGISFVAIVPLVLWLGSLAMPVFETVEIGKETDKMAFTKHQQVVAKISFWAFVVSVIVMSCIRLGLFGSWYWFYHAVGVGCYLFGALFICWFYSAIHSVRKGQESWLKSFNRYGLWALVVLVALICVLFGIAQYMQYETDLLENDVIGTIFMGAFLGACIIVFLFVFVGWMCNTFIIFISARDSAFVTDEKMRKIKRVSIWGGLLFLMVLAINAVVKYEVEKRKGGTSEEVGYRLRYGDVQYSDSIVINMGWISGEHYVYNINTKSKMHEDEIVDLLLCDEVADSMIVYKDTAMNRGYLNVVTGEIEIKAEYDHAWLFSEGVAAVVKDNKIGFIDKDNNVVIPFQYPMYASYAPYTYRFYNGYCKVTDEEGRCGLIDYSGNWVIEPKYQRIKKPVFNKYRKVKLNDKWGLLDENLKLILPIKYDYISVLDSMATQFEVTYEGMMYKINRQGKFLETLDYSYIHPFYDINRTWERTSGRYMQVWVRQEHDVDYIFEDYDFNVDRYLDNCEACFRCGIIDVIENKVVVPFEYCEIEFDNLPQEIDAESSLVFKCIGPQPRAGWVYEPDVEWITVDGKKVSVKYE